MVYTVGKSGIGKGVLPMPSARWPIPEEAVIMICCHARDKGVLDALPKN